MLPGTMALAGAAANDQSQITLTFVDSATSTTNTIAIPAAAQAGDLAIAFDTAHDSSSTPPTKVTPSGWTTIVDKSGNPGGGSDGTRIQIAYKVLVGGDLSTSPGFTNGTDDNKGMIVVRPSSTISSVTPSTFNQSLSDNDPSVQTVSAAGQPSPLIVVAVGLHDSSPPTFTVNSPALTTFTVDEGDPAARFGYLIYNGAPADHSLDIGDSGTVNGLISGYIQVN